MDDQINLFQRTKKVLICRSSDRSIQPAPPNRSGSQRTLLMPEFVTLKLGETRGGAAKKLHALRTTADYYGWTKEFEEWSLKAEFEEGGRRFGIDPGRRGHPQCSSGYRVRICRSPVRDGLPAGFTNAFKVTANTGLFDLAELAHFTDVEWYWMTTKTGERVSREEWAARYAARL